MFGPWWANNIQFRGNTIEDLRTGLSTKMLRVGDTSSNNTFTGNTFITNSGSEPSYQDEGTGNVFTENMFIQR